MKLITLFCETYQVLMRRAWRFFRSTTQLLCPLRLKVEDGVGFKLQVLIAMKRQQILDQVKRVLEMKRLFQQNIAMGKVLTKSEDIIGRIYQVISNANDSFCNRQSTSLARMSDIFRREFDDYKSSNIDIHARYIRVMPYMQHASNSIGLTWSVDLATSYSKTPYILKMSPITCSVPSMVLLA